jgi:hypothetical protein
MWFSKSNSGIVQPPMDDAAMRQLEFEQRRAAEEQAKAAELVAAMSLEGKRNALFAKRRELGEKLVALHYQPESEDPNVVFPACVEAIRKIGELMQREYELKAKAKTKPVFNPAGQLKPDAAERIYGEQVAVWEKEQAEIKDLPGKIEDWRRRHAEAIQEWVAMQAQEAERHRREAAVAEVFLRQEINCVDEAILAFCKS